MSQDIGVELERDEIEEFLQDQSLGVLGLATDGEAYTIPIAFAYDRGTNRCFFRFVMSDNSRKRAFVTETDRASLTVYEWNTKSQWVSVVASGPIRHVSDSDLSHAATLFSEVGEEAALEIFNDDLSEYESVWYELSVSEITGRGQYVGSRESLV
ncbi:pyridoxamine 5'-phosphate oxidase family protein [Haloarchaeobius amylolyticus]|uniref:Pyridoxamine 5'-phosphate oxidase family protein n=1 Tax=Haloarchaeobius amylolyticus TaxID=1198296 RepID=A0ABD6BEP8_9EURY